MKFAYADPPYLGCGKLYDAHHADSRAFDDPLEHGRLIDRLVSDYADGWAMSVSTPSLRVLLPLCPADVRIAAWVKPFAVFKPNVGVAYAWEPVIFRGGRRRTREQDTVRDWIAENITLKKGLTGAKPAAFCRWVCDMLNVHDGDSLDDLFPGTGVMANTFAARHQPRQLSMTEPGVTG